MVLNLKKMGSIILTVGIVILAVFIFWPHANSEKQLPPEAGEEYNQIAGNDSLLTAPTTPSADDFFAEYRLERERVRGRQIELLREVLNSSEQKAAQQEASLQLVKISADMEKEFQAEGMIKSKGYAECLVIIQDETILIVAQSDNMRLDQEEELKEIVKKITGYKEENLCIIYREAQ